MSSSAAEVEVRARPTPGTWELDPAHTTVGFVARHLGLAKVRGRFTRFTGTIEVGEDLESSHAEAVAETASIETGSTSRDDHLKSPDFLDVERWPELRFESKSIRPERDGTWKVEGDLTIRDVTRPVVLDVEFDGEVPDPMAGKQRAGFSASTEIDRYDFGVTWNAALEVGGVVGRKVRIEIDAEALLTTDEAQS